MQSKNIPSSIDVASLGTVGIKTDVKYSCYHATISGRTVREQKQLVAGLPHLWQRMQITAIELASDVSVRPFGQAQTGML